MCIDAPFHRIVAAGMPLTEAKRSIYLERFSQKCKPEEIRAAAAPAGAQFK